MEAGKVVAELWRRTEGNTAVSEIRVPHPTVGPHFALSFFEVEDGRLVRAREYWVEERYEPPSPERARWLEDSRP